MRITAFVFGRKYANLAIAVHHSRLHRHGYSQKCAFSLRSSCKKIQQYYSMKLGLFFQQCAGRADVDAIIRATARNSSMRFMRGAFLNAQSMSSRSCLSVQRLLKAQSSQRSRRRWR